MNSKIDINQLYSEKLRNVLACLEAGPGTINDIISRAFKKKFSFKRPKKDVARSLKILEIMGFARKRVDGDKRLYEKIDPEPHHESGIYLISRGLEIILEELDNANQETSISNLGHLMNDFSSDQIGLILDLLKNRTQIKIEGDRIYKSVTVFSYKKTSDQ